MPLVLEAWAHGPTVQRHAHSFCFALLRVVLLSSAVNGCWAAAASTAQTARGVVKSSIRQTTADDVHGTGHAEGARLAADALGGLSSGGRESARAARNGATAASSVPEYFIMRRERPSAKAGRSEGCTPTLLAKAARKASAPKTVWALLESALLGRPRRKKSGPGPGPPSTKDVAEDIPEGDPCADVNVPTGPAVMGKHVVAVIPNDGEVDELPAEAHDNQLAENESSAAWMTAWIMGIMLCCVLMLLCGIGAQRVLMDSKARKLKKMREKKRQEEEEAAAEQAAGTAADDGSDFGSRRGTRRGSEPDF